MPSVIGKRKREQKSDVAPTSKKSALDSTPTQQSKVKPTANNTVSVSPAPVQYLPAQNGSEKPLSHAPIHVQIVTGSYERVLHGIIATIPRKSIEPTTAPQNESPSSEQQNGTANGVTFSDSFLFTAHSSAIRCLAISPATGEADKRILATGSSDERINVYSLSTAPPQKSATAAPKLPTLGGTTATTTENSRNRSLGSLIHHDRAITGLEFPTKSKLFSSAEDATIAISRTRDWTMLSSIKAPIPKPQGRPSGDTAGPGEIPAGVNAFAIHPSQKLMLSVGRGEKCMRLWNLMTGKKAGVLNFDRELITQAGEGKFSSGEGRSLIWDEDGTRFVVGFERGAALFGSDCKPEGLMVPSPRTKLHRMRIVPNYEDLNKNIVAVSTEDGRILFFNLYCLRDQDKEQILMPHVECIGEMGGASVGITGRVKDFDILYLGPGLPLLFTTASSDGAVRLWLVEEGELAEDNSKEKQLGRLLATLETGDRLTCMGSFILDGKLTEEDEEEEFQGFDAEGGDEDDDDDLTEDD